MPNPALGVTLHAVGGLAAASFYAPLKKVRGWRWESAWLLMGAAAWLVAPWAAAMLTTADLTATLAEGWRTERGAMLAAMGFGLLWGIGNLTFGLSVRYLGMALGYSLALGACMIFGTLIPPLRAGTLDDKLQTLDGQVVLGGVLVCLVGVGLCAVAGRRREKETQPPRDPADEQTAGANPGVLKGVAIAMTAGLLSACFAIAFDAGSPLAEISARLGTSSLYTNNVVTAVVLVGGFVSNAAWCVLLQYRNRSWQDCLAAMPGRGKNYGLALASGVIWYLQFFFYSMGTTRLGEAYEFSSWSIHMAFIIAFSNLWGLAFREWKGVGATTKAWLWAGIVTLLGSTIVIGLGNKIAAAAY